MYDKKMLKVKGRVHPKMKTHSLSTHLHVDKKSNEVHSLTKHFWSFTIKQNVTEFTLNN